MQPTNHARDHQSTPASVLPLPAWWLGEKKDILYPNESFCAHTGAANSLSATELAEYLHPLDRDSVLKLIENPPSEKQSLYLRLLGRNGAYRWHCLSWAPCTGQESPGGYLSLLQDIHELYNQEEYLQQRFRKIFDETFQLTALTDLEGRLLETNRSALVFGGYSPESVYGKPLWEAGWWNKNPQSRQRLKQAVQQAAAGKLVRIEEWIQGAGGKEIYIDFSLKPVYGDNQQAQYLIAEGHDITELKKTKDQLKVSEIKWRTLVENTPDIIARHDTSLRYLFINSAIQRSTGLSVSHFIGKLPEEVALPQGQIQHYKYALQRALQEKKQVEYTIQRQASRNSQALFITITPELNEHREVESLLVLTRDITELQEKEKQLAQANRELLISNAKLRNILDSTKDAICSRDMDMRLLAFNKAYAEEFHKIYGIDPEVGQTIEETIGHLPDEFGNSLNIWKRALRGEEFTILQEFGDSRYERKYYEITLAPIYGEHGLLIGATSITHDVTRERNIEKELKDAREFLILAENMPQIIFTTNSSGTPDYLNQAFYEYTGLHEVDMRSSFGDMIVQPGHLEPLRAEWARAISMLEGIELEIQMRHNTGEYRWNLLRFLPLINGDHHAYKWIGSITDIHEAKVTEERQRLAAQEFRQLADSLPQIIWTARPDGFINYLNNKWYEYTGLNPEERDTNDWSTQLHPEDREQAIQSWEHAVANKEEYLVEYRFRNQQGQYRWFLGRGLPLYTEQGEVIKWFGSATDIHDQKLQNKQLWQQNLQLNQINQYLDNFVHTAAHDLRAPIANIKGLLGLLQDAAEDKKEIILRNLELSAERLDTTLQGMIQLIEVQSHTGDISRDINVAEVFFETLADFESELSAIEYEVETDFEGCPNITFVLPYLKSSFRNLLSNSIKYRKAEEKLKLKVRCRQEGDFLVFTFQDNGIGIDMARVGKNLFRPFRRFTNQAQGKGIGMHIVKNMLVKTGGKISVESKLGEGTTFYLYFKIQQDARGQEEPDYTKMGN